TAHSTIASSLTATPAPAITLTCPSANSTTYTATNKPQPTLSPQFQRPNETLEYEVLCDTNEQSFVSDLQDLSNVTSLRECIDACALFTFQSPATTGACTAVVWTNDRDGQLNPGTNECILKANVTLSSVNESSNSPGYDGAVLWYT
ncbi:hypothetical protein MMC28_011666, partial [Mycoblastus sanguinarius]|nr:hypothetical protein [Mycoblastus sanguinarius]